MKLKQKEIDRLKAMLDATIPKGGGEGLELSAVETGGVEIFEEMIFYLPKSTATGLRAALFFIEFIAPAFVSFRPRRFTRLTPEKQEDVLYKMSKSRVYLVRNMLLLIKSVACMGWGANQKVRFGLGYTDEPKIIRPDGEVAS